MAASLGDTGMIYESSLVLALLWSWTIHTRVFLATLSPPGSGPRGAVLPEIVLVFCYQDQIFCYYGPRSEILLPCSVPWSDILSLCTRIRYFVTMDQDQIYCYHVVYLDQIFCHYVVYHHQIFCWYILNQDQIISYYVVYQDQIFCYYVVSRIWYGK